MACINYNLSSTLSTAARRAPITVFWLSFRSWSLDIVRALDHLHNRNPIIMHRDLKPGNAPQCRVSRLVDVVYLTTYPCSTAANMMLSKDLNTLKLADFGMSKKMYHEERTQVLIGHTWVFCCGLTCSWRSDKLSDGTQRTHWDSSIYGAWGGGAEN